MGETVEAGVRNMDVQGDRRRGHTSRLHGRGFMKKKIPWKLRLKAAVGAAVRMKGEGLPRGGL